MKLLATTFSLLMTFFGLTFNVTPNIPVLIIAVVALMGVDFSTGIVKAKLNKQQRTSEGYRRTVKKTTQYFSAILLSLGLKYLVMLVAKDAHDSMLYVSMFVLIFIIYIEIVSILENLDAIDSKSKFSKYVIRPALFILKIGLEKNPLIQKEEEIKNNEKK